MMPASYSLSQMVSGNQPPPLHPRSLHERLQALHHEIDSLFAVQSLFLLSMFAQT